MTGPTRSKSNANVYIDYENVWTLLQRYKTNPLTIDFFSVILDRLRNVNNLNIIDCIAYCNFEKNSFDGRIQTIIRRLGIQTRHSVSGAKNRSNILLTVDALLALAKYPCIDMFVIISSNNDILPLLKTIKADNKQVRLISSRLGFNGTMAKYATSHEYLEDILGLSLPRDGEHEYISDTARAEEASRLLFCSKVWQNYQKTGHPVTLKGYAPIIAGVVKRTPAQIIEDFRLAYFLKYIELYRDPKQELCLKKGANYEKVFKRNDDIKSP